MVSVHKTVLHGLSLCEILSPFLIVTEEKRYQKEISRSNITFLLFFETEYYAKRKTVLSSRISLEQS